jgi:tetratricopeptide (TPR) repeat protein
VNGLAFSGDNRRLLAADALGQIHVWDLWLIRKRLAQMNLDWDMPPYTLQNESPAPGNVRFEVVSVGSEFQNLAFCNNRADSLARQGLWKEAAAEAAHCVELQPSDPLQYHTLALLLIASADLEGYRKLCVRILAQFGGTNKPVRPKQLTLLGGATGEPAIAERMAKDCLILPSAEVDLGMVAELADLALAGQSQSRFLPSFQCTKGLTEYRRGNFLSAVDWSRKSLVGTSPGDYFRHVQAQMVIAMSYYRLNRIEEARSALTKGIEIAEGNLPSSESGDFGDDWRDWIIANTLTQEATSLIDAGVHEPENN